MASTPKLFDAYNRPVDLAALREEQAMVRLASIRTPFYPSQADGLTPQTLGNILHQTDIGQILEFLTLAIEMEEREPHYAAVLGTRKQAVIGCSVTVEAATDDAKDVQIAEELQAIVDSDHFSGLEMDALDAIGKGFSAVEIMWDTSESQWQPKGFVYRDPRHFVFDRETYSTLRMRDFADPVWGLELAPFKFVQHRPHLRSGLPIKGGLARLVAISYMCKGYALKDWLAFAETFGMPLRLGKYHEGASAEQKRALLTAVANIGTDAAAIIPDSMLIEFVQADKSAGGDKLFEGLANWLDKQVSKAVLGQTMTSDDGSSRAQAQVHNEVRKDILSSDTAQLAATLRRDLVKPYVDLNHGLRKEREYPRLRIAPEEKEDLESLSKSLPPFIELGLRVEEKVILDKFGLPQPKEGAPVLGGGKGTAPASLPGEGRKPGEPVVTDDPSNKPITEPVPSPKKGGLETDKTPAADKVINARRLRDGAVATLTAKVLAGETLTDDQRRFLELAAQQPDDEIDAIVAGALPGWKGTMGGMLEPIIRLAERCTSAEEFQAELATLELDSAELTQALALLTFKARGLGDATDKP